MASLKAASELTGEASPGVVISPARHRSVRKALGIEANVVQHIREVLRCKEQELEQLQKEIEALRLSLQILEREQAAPTRMEAEPVEEMPATDHGIHLAGSAHRQFP